jgi:hypothetical protein
MRIAWAVLMGIVGVVVTAVVEIWSLKRSEPDWDGSQPRSSGWPVGGCRPALGTR